MKRRPGAICNEKRPCRGLSEQLQSNGQRGGGLHAKCILNMESGEQAYCYVSQSHAADRGIVLNYCPFCGRRINKRWTK